MNHPDDIRRVLIVAHGFPPVGGIGVQRPYKFTQYLPEYGWQPVVLTHDAKYSATWDASLLESVSEVPIHRAVDPIIEVHARNHKRRQAQKTLAAKTGSGDIDTTKHVTTSTTMANVTSDLTDTTATRSAGDREEAKRQISAASETFSYINKIKGWAFRVAKRLKDAVMIPDESVLWVPSAVNLGLKVLRSQPIDAIYSTSPPESSQLVAAILSEKTGVPLIIDFRDPWIGNLHRKGKGIRHVIEQNLEAFAFSRAARIITVTESFRAAFIERYPQHRDKIFVVPNGYDAQDFKISAAPVRDGSKMVIYYGGILYEKRSPRVFLQGLAKALNDGRIPRDKIRVEFAGVFDYPGKTANYDEVMRLHLEDIVEVIGYLAHQEHVREMAAADILLLIGDQTVGSEAYVPAKLYEYLGMGKPILAVTKTGESTRLIDMCHAGLVCDPVNPDKVAQQLVSYFEKWQEDRLSSWQHSPLASKYERKEQAHMLSDHLTAISLA